ncbi:MAG TPA: alkaline phosphatase family protein [Actinomycetota bacterium]|nr:alkaline phosphatase family protein [Actinomycetota bacterium]
MTRRLPLLALLLFVGACTTDAPAGEAAPPTEPSVTASPDASPAALGRYAEIACDLPRNQLQRIVNGYITGKSGEIQFVLRTPHFFGLYSHSGPWNYLQRVPIFFYGPGHVPAAGQIGRPVTVADMAPTLAGHLGFEFDTADGDPLAEAIEGSGDPPRLVLVVVWDAGGRNVLAAHQAAWTPVSRLIPQGAWFEHATVGSSPSVTPAVHATLGSGVLPRRHGVLDLRIREGDKLVGPILNGPQYMLEPTLADEWDRANGNRPVIGLIASEPTLGMMGHGSYLDGADRDIALGQREGIWGLTPENQKYFEFRDYVNDIGGLDEAVRRLDTEDGTLDGAWLGHPLETPDDILHTPAYAEYQTDVIAEVIRREGFGEDEVPDILFTNYKQIDKMGHRWSFPTPQMAAVVRSSAREFVALTRLLDREVGRGEWVMALTADHGATPLASQTGAYAIDQNALTDDINAALDTDGDAVPVVSSFRVTQLWINVAELEENGHVLGDVADFLMEYTALDNTADPAALSPSLQNERLFAAAFPGTVLDGLPCLDQPSG